MPSSVIRRFVYDQMEQQLWVEFTTGRRYVYADVPQEVATPSVPLSPRAFISTPGSATNFRYREITRARGNPFLKRVAR